jgi:hypothetical protein
MSQLFQCHGCRGVYADTQRDGSLYFHACPPLPPDDNGIEAERPNKRDENIATHRTGRLLGIRLEGAGVKCISDAAIVEPAWITTMKKRIAKEEEA